MKFTLLVSVLLTVLIAQIAHARTVEVDVHGMTCAFCVDSLERQFKKMKSISKVEVSLKNKKIRLETENTLPTLETIKQTVVETGFTPVKIKVLNSEKE